MSLFKHKAPRVRDPFDFAIKIPEGWCSHSPDPDPGVQQKTTEQGVDKMIQTEPVLAEARGEIIQRMLGFAREANEKGSMAAASLWTVVDGTEAAANMMVFSAARDASEGIDETIGRLKDSLSSPEDDDVKERDVRVVELPAGQAVRLRVLAKSPPEDGQADMVIEVVQYWLPVPDAGHSLIVSCTTPCLVYGDQLAGVFDSIADSLRLT